jgi:hypothetical protein
MDETSAAGQTEWAEFTALRTEVQARYERTIENQRTMSEQIVEQRADVKAIRAVLERLERRIDRSDRAPSPR